MFRGMLLLLLTITVSLDATLLEAQRIRRARRWYRNPYRVGYGAVWTPFGWVPGISVYRYGYGYGYGGVTPYGDYARGMADVIRSSGLAAENYSRAMINYQEARSKYIENQKKWLETYYERKRMGEAARRAQAEERRARTQRYLAWKKKQPHPRLSPDELDPQTGAINWPAALQAPEFYDDRRELEELFALRARTGSTPALTTEIQKKAEEMRIKLLDKVRELPAKSYMEARRFLERMVHEAHHAEG